MRLKDFTKLYIGLVILHLAVIYKPDSQLLFYISKPALVFSLLAFFIHRIRGFNISSSIWITLALVASLAGDVFLMFTGEQYFLFGMAAFAIAQIGYSIFYLRQQVSINWGVIVTAMMIPLGAGLVLYKFVNTPTDLEPFLYTYAVLLGIHFVTSSNFSWYQKGFAKMAMVGAFLFISSDLILAFGKFNGGDTLLNMAVMLTYAFAQYFIVTSVIHYLEPKQEAQ